ncbi:MAG: hypothetical protein PHC28_12540 [Flavobacterium sp.]|uniref:hypothetical protein n=1 Tax=Flavobacterium sp. TaxID=239 RepID=UPI002639BF55|nr:hypothetical protein [Flavobacterium sp.]MDD5151280.1 hypothetical protein [Flavobacterium sp.]
MTQVEIIKRKAELLGSIQHLITNIMNIDEEEFITVLSSLNEKNTETLKKSVDILNGFLDNISFAASILK